MSGSVSSSRMLRNEKANAGRRLKAALLSARCADNATARDARRNFSLGMQKLHSDKEAALQAAFTERLHAEADANRVYQNDLSKIDGDRT